MTNKITEVQITFEGPKGAKQIVKYVMLSDATFIQQNNPQGREPGYLNVKGPVSSVDTVEV